MQKTLITLFLAIGFAVTAGAQTKAVQKATIKTPGARCEECKTRIETYLNRYDGITQVQVNFRKGETKVTFISDRINIEEVKAAIANAGYDVDDVLAGEDAYKRLPKSCKKPEDGGHPNVKPLPPPAPPES